MLDEQVSIYSLILHLISCSSLSAASSTLSPFLILNLSSWPCIMFIYSFFVVAGIDVLRGLVLLDIRICAFVVWLLEHDRQVDTVSQVFEMVGLISTRWEILENYSSGVRLFADDGIFLKEAL